ncbi:hypothetical protein [Enterococcus pallens]|uniref:Uncharacterized protein n=1 Tax=Enterococcus pallens ATCC BAA-351 TaxID=1158607 RepID=R2QN78_9ENTE|nr:hypothetical protein [Enterococcus pallens]EOH97977.1 hypothetical protein UAU_00646 [Enterococcus pallens ATCC BAA-351]EOU20604.1 hypothetical protein I588_01450 [Enterococcus pallens ATCC BAA-351]OJG80370.1 hypothetical protein RV10_GL004582 [Enterococcus pallens]
MSKTTASNVKLEARQLFSIKSKKTLEARFESHFTENANAVHIIQAALVVLVRNFFSENDFSDVARKRIRSLFLTSSDDLSSVRHLCSYFQPFFSSQEWQTVISRLFKNQQEFLTLTEQARSHMNTLGPILHSKEQTTDRKRILKAAFEDENGKLHSWSLGNAVRPLTKQDRKAVLDILGEVTILQKDDGTRKFVRVVKMHFAVDEREYDFNMRDEKDPMFESQEAEKESSASTSKTASAKPSKAAQVPDSNSQIIKSNKTAESKPDKASPAEEAAPPVKSQSELAREMIGKLTSDHSKKLKDSNTLFNKSKQEKKPTIEQASKKKGKKGKNRKRNRRK